MIRALVIDNDPEFLRTTARYISNGDRIGLDLARSVDEALAALRAGTFDIIVASIDLEDDDGARLLDRLESEVLELPVIFYGRQVKEKTIIDAIRRGAEFVLQLSDEPKAQLLELRSLIEEIVSRRKAESALRSTVEDLRAIITNSADAMVILDRKGCIQFVNPAAESLFNMPESEMIGKLFGFPIVLQEPVDMYVIREFRRFVAVEMRMVEVQWKARPSYLLTMRDVTWHVKQEEELAQTKDRLEAEAEDRSRDLVEACHSLRSEVAERKRAELALRESERKYRQIVELANEGICMVDKTAVIRFVNPRMAGVLGFRQEEMIGKPIYNFVDPDFVATQRYVLQRRKQGISETYDGSLLKKNGSKLMAIVNAAPLFDEDESYTGTVAMYTDVTGRRKSEEDLKEAKAQAELYLDLMGHDIRNLAQIAIGYLELARETDDIDEIRSLLDKPLQSLEDTAQIIDNVRKLQNTQREKETIEPINLCELLAAIKSKYETTSERNITINLKAVRRCQAMANSLVADVFVNLIGNSIKHSDPERPLHIGINVDRFREKGVEYLRISVEDNGPGISNWVKDKIFMRFQRGDTRAHGKGLGLHIARTLVESYGGKIWVEDRVPGDYTKGARFVVVLPAV